MAAGIRLPEDLRGHVLVIEARKAGGKARAKLYGPRGKLRFAKIVERRFVGRLAMAVKRRGGKVILMIDLGSIAVGKR